jgi:hypothetical protein
MKAIGPAALSFVALLSLCCCRTLSGEDPFRFERAPLFGMIYDRNNTPCPGVSISVDGRDVFTSDINGRFVLPDLARGAHTLHASARNTESLDVPFEFLNRGQVLYLRMVSFAQLLVEAELALDAGGWQEAGSLIGRAAAVCPGEPVTEFLRAVLLLKTGRYADAKMVVRGLLADGPVEPSLLLFLADLCEYHLAEPEEAMRALGAYLEREGDPDVERRLDHLRSSPQPVHDGGAPSDAPSRPLAD